MLNSKKKNHSMKINTHSVKNILNLNSDNKEEIKLFAKRFGITLKDKELDLNLSLIEVKILYSILECFTLTNYSGNINPISLDKAKKDLCFFKEKNEKGTFDNSFKKVKDLPRIRLSNNELIQLIGGDVNNRMTRSRIIQSCYELSSKQFTLFYKRLKKDQEDNIVLDEKHKYSFETVLTRGFLFSFSIVDEGKKDTYFEIILHPMFLDQIDSFFIFVQKNWIKEVNDLPKVKTSKYIFSFLLFLSYEFEIMRKKKTFSKNIKVNWKDLVRILRMPVSWIKDKRKTKELFNEIYQVSKELGYLFDYSQEGDLEELTLNKLKFYSPENKKEKKHLIGKSISKENSKQIDLKVVNSDEDSFVNAYHSEILKISPQYDFSCSNGEKENMLNLVSNWVEKYPLKLIIKGMKDLLNDSFWGGRLTNYKLFVNNFPKAWIEWITKNGEILKKKEIEEEEKKLSEILEKNKMLITKLAKENKISVEFSKVGFLFNFEDGSKSRLIKMSLVESILLEEAKKTILETKDLIEINKKNTDIVIEKFKENKFIDILKISNGVLISLKLDLISFKKLQKKNWQIEKKFSISNFEKSVTDTAMRLEKNYHNFG